MTEESYQSPEPTWASRDAIQKFAEFMANSLNFGHGDDIDKLVKRLGGKVTYPKKDLEVDGWRMKNSLFVESLSDFHIFIESRAFDQRNRFTIAHELGHLFLHSDNGSKKIEAKRGGSSRVEREANWFAAEFLMPQEQVKKLKLSGKTAYQMADIFGVSPTAMLVRIESLVP